MKKIIIGLLFVGAACLAACSDDKLPEANFSLFQAEKITATPGDREVTLTWTPSDKGTPQEYLVLWTAATAGVEGGSQSVAANITTLKVEGLVNAVKYTFSVQARYPEGLSGKVTTSVTPVTSRYDVTDFLAEAGADKVRLTWKKPAQAGDRLQGYTVSMMPGDRKIEISDKNTERCFVDGLTEGETYTFTLVVRYSNGDSEGVSSEATPGEVTPINVASTELARSEPATFSCNDLYFMGDIASASWSFGDGTTSTELIPTHKYTDKGTYTVAVTVTYADKSTAQGEIEMTVVDFKWSSLPLLYGDYSGAVKASNPVFSPDGGAFYIPTSNGKGHLFAVNTYTGVIKWVYEIDKVTYGGGAAVGADGMIYQGSNNKKFHAISPDGKAKWVFDAPNNIECFPAVTSDGKVYFSCVDGTEVAAYAFDGATGNQLWVKNIDGSTGSAVVVDASGNVYFGTSKAVYSFDAAGNQRWRTPSDVNVTERGSMAISGTTLFAALKGGAGIASIDMSSGAINWQSGFATGDSYFPIVDKSGVVFFTDKGTGKIFAVNPDGQKKWEADSGSALIYAGLVLSSDGKLYVGTQKAGAFKLLGADAATGSLFLDEAAADQVMSGFSIGPDGRLYYGTVSGKILTRELDAELESGSWSMRGGNAQGTNSLK